MEIFAWFFFLVFALTTVITFFVSLSFAQSKDKSNEDPLVMLLVTSMISSIVFFFSKEIFTIETSMLIWKITNAVIAITGVIIYLYFKKPGANFIKLSVTLGLSAIPFTINPNIDAANKFTASLIENNYSQFLYIIVSALLFVLLLVFILYNNRRIINKDRRRHYSILRDLAMDNKNDFGESTFKDPYYELIGENLSSKLNDIQKAISKFSLITKESSVNNEDIKQLLREFRMPENGSNLSKPPIIENWVIEENYNPVDSKSQQDMIKQLNHFLQTPFSSIVTAIELAKNELNDKKRLLTRFIEIGHYIQISHCVLQTYRNIETVAFATNDTETSLDDMINSAFKMYVKSESKEDIKLKYTNTLQMQLNSCTLISILLPLIQNAVTASPKNSLIEIEVTQNKVVIGNKCILLPKQEDLKISEYSSKGDHKGTGLMIARDLCSRVHWEFEIIVDRSLQKVIQTVNMK